MPRFDGFFQSCCVTGFLKGISCWSGRSGSLGWGFRNTFWTTNSVIWLVVWNILSFFQIVRIVFFNWRTPIFQRGSNQAVFFWWTILWGILGISNLRWSDFCWVELWNLCLKLIKDSSKYFMNQDPIPQLHPCGCRGSLRWMGWEAEVEGTWRYFNLNHWIGFRENLQVFPWFSHWWGGVDGGFRIHCPANNRPMIKRFLVLQQFVRPGFRDISCQIGQKNFAAPDPRSICITESRWHYWFNSTISTMHTWGMGSVLYSTWYIYNHIYI